MKQMSVIEWLSGVAKNLDDIEEKKFNERKERVKKSLAGKKINSSLDKQYCTAVSKLPVHFFEERNGVIHGVVIDHLGDWPCQWDLEGTHKNTFYYDLDLVSKDTEIAEDTLVRIWRDDKEDGFLRYAKEVLASGNIECYNDGKTSKTATGTTIWRNWEVVK